MRLPGAFGDPLWGDEVATARIVAEDTPISALRQVARGEASPPGFYALAWTTAQAGNAVADAGGPAELRSEKLSRLWSILFALGTVGLVVLLASPLMPLPAAGLAGLMVALGYQFVEHGMELRAYSMLTLTAVAFPLLLQRAQETPLPGRLAALGGIVAVGSMTHYFFELVVVTGIAWLLMLRPGGHVVRRVVLAVAAGSIPLLLWTPALVHQTTGRRSAREWVGEFSIGRVAGTPADLFVGPGAWGGARGAAHLVILGVVLAGCAVLWRTGQPGRLVALLTIVPALVAASVWLAGARVYDTRNLLVIGPFVAIAVAASVAAIPRTPFAVLAGLVVAAVMVYAVEYELGLGRTPHDRIASTAVELGWSPSEPVVFFGNYWSSVPVGWYLPDHPELVAVEQRGNACRRALVVAETTAGRRLLREFKRQILEVRALPYYGPLPRGKRRREDLRVAVIRWTPELARIAVARGAYLFGSSLAPENSCGLVQTG